MEILKIEILKYSNIEISNLEQNELWRKIKMKFEKIECENYTA